MRVKIVQTGTSVSECTLEYKYRMGDREFDFSEFWKRYLDAHRSRRSINEKSLASGRLTTHHSSMLCSLR